MTNFVLPPGFIFIFTAIMLPFIPARFRHALLLLVPCLALGLLLITPADASVTFRLLDLPIALYKPSAYSLIFAVIFLIMAFAGHLYALRQASTLELSAANLYIGAALGVVFAGDWLSVFIFWELMAIGSTLIVWASVQNNARRAGLRYLLIHLLGGVLLMAGIAALVANGQSTELKPLKLDSLSSALILAGLLVNVGAPPFSAWIPDAYPEASPSGSVYLSAYTTKTAVYVLLVVFPGTELLIYVGLFMIFYGIIYALLENDMRRILAYSIVNQVGFMVTGIGLGSPLALNGVAAHAFAHIIYKALLFMSAGSVLFQTGKRKCTDLGGLYHSMPKTAACGIIGALAISAFPLTSGFVTKSMITEATHFPHLAWIGYLLTAATAGVFLHAGIKFPWFVFFQKDSGLRPAEPPWNMRYAMYLFAFLCLALGIYPDPLYSLLKQPVDYQPYVLAHVVSQTQLLLFSGLAFFLLLPFLKRTLTITLDLDWFYRVLMPALARRSLQVYRRGRDYLAYQQLSTRTLWRPLSELFEKLARRNRSVAGMLWWTLVVFSAVLLMFHVVS